MEEMQDIMSERSPSTPPSFSQSSRSSSWPLSQPNHRMRAHRYNLRHRPGRVLSTAVSDNGSAASPRATPELLDAAAPTQQQRPSRLQVLAQLLRQGLLIAAIFYAGIVVGWNLMRQAAEARRFEAAATATPAPQEKQQYLAERLGADLQILHHLPLTALGIMSPPASDASVEEVEQCKRAVGKSYRKLSAVWHPDSCPYRKQGILAEWQCAELYQTLDRKRNSALFRCLNTEMAVAESAMRTMGRRSDEWKESG